MFDLFGEKATKIEQLEAEIEVYHDKNEELARKVSQLQASLAQAEIQASYHEHTADEQASLNEALNDENRGLVFQIECLRAMLKQIHVVVRLPPVRKLDK